VAPAPLRPSPGTSAWSLASIPNPQGPSGTFSAVSCTSSSACTAVGYSATANGAPVTLAERWNGTAWATQPTPSPGGSTASYLTGVSCASASACTAVGYYYNSTGAVVTLAERWNGRTWAIQTTPSPGGSDGSYLYAVSCPSASACTAVGYYFNTIDTVVTLAERWNGTTWTTQSTTNPGGTAGVNYLYAVSCPSASACTAVGYYDSSLPAEVTLAERWNGTAWATQSTTSPGGTQGSYLYAVSCPSASACTAVGYYNNSNFFPETLAERWNGTAWATQPTPNPSDTSSRYLYGVSCPSASDCTAAGYYTNSTDAVVTLAERWNGTAWTIQSTPNPSGAEISNLYAVSCTSDSACTGAGSYGTGATLAEGWNGTAWAAQSTPNPSGAEDSYLTAVSCSSATSCTAVGYHYTYQSLADVTLAERWNGTAWAIQPIPSPGGPNSPELLGVSCSSASACTAVGYYYNSAGTVVTVAERWNGTTWAIQTTANPSGSAGSYLYAVSCPSASACTAVGEYSTGTGNDVALAERWNGTAWAVQSVPRPSGSQGSDLYGVSCPSASACTAVGTYFNSSLTGVTLAERWNGTAWAIQPIPSPSGARYSELLGVSCPSASDCTAAGDYYTSSTDTDLTLAERWNGTAWAIQSTPNPSGSQGSNLAGVSCTSASDCTAVGQSATSTVPVVTLAERWNGTAWAIQSTPNPSGAEGSSLTGVSCSSASACAAVGIYNVYPSLPANVTLAERYS
jgi:hypothetical protein